MKIKKSKRANLEKKRKYFLLTGLGITTALALLAFEWSSTELRLLENQVGELKPELGEEVVFNMPPVPKPEAKPKPKQKAFSSESKIIETEKKPETGEKDFINSNTEVDFGKIELGNTEIPGGGEGPVKVPVNKTYTLGTISKDPVFDGDLYKWIGERIRYPREALNIGAEGTAIIGFVVDKYGRVKDVEIMKDPGYGMGEEALRIVKMMPKWIPGEQLGVNVKVRYYLPVKFTAY